MDTAQDTYAGPRHDGEYQRLRTQHDMIKSNMGGKLVIAPVAQSDVNLCVLDSATADGYWLVDLSHSLAKSARLVGADISAQHFLPESDRPKNVSLMLHNIFDEWPEDMHNTFDLVHQRFVLPVCGDEASVDAIAKLCKCVRPGGYAQLHDGDMETIEEGPNNGAMMRFRDVMVQSWRMLGHNLSPGPKLGGWLKQVGMEDVEESIVVSRCGIYLEDQEQSERAISVLVALLDGIQTLLGGKSWPFE